MRLNSLPDGKRPDSCIACGACLSHCPQQLNIPALLKEMSEAMIEMMS